MELFAAFWLILVCDADRDLYHENHIISGVEVVDAMAFSSTEGEYAQAPTRPGTCCGGGLDLALPCIGCAKVSTCSSTWIKYYMTEWWTSTQNRPGTRYIWCNQSCVRRLASRMHRLIIVECHLQVLSVFHCLEACKTSGSEIAWRAYSPL